MAGAVGLELTTCGFGDRCSSQLSYTPKLPKLLIGHCLPGLPMQGVLAVELTELFLLKPARSVPLFLFSRVVAVLALGALQCDNFARHLFNLSYLAEYPERPRDRLGTPE